MQVNKLRRIVIASVLKPVDDPRMFEKIGCSFVKQGQAEVHILGFPSPSPAIPPDNLFLHPIETGPFNRLSWKRFIAPWKILNKTKRLRPEVFIITTHELLLTAILVRILTGSKIIYDVQENYYRNILYTKTFPGFTRPLLAIWVRMKEILFSPWVNYFILAEQGYAHELPFFKPYIILQNKLTKAIADVYQQKDYKGYSKLIFSGTLAEISGVFKAVEIASNLQALDPTITLTIIGHCASTDDFQKLKKISLQHPFISFLGEPHPVPHSKILQEIHRADYGIIYYPENPATSCSLPTKLFEYLGLNLPILIKHNPESHQLVALNKAGIILTEAIDYMTLLQKMRDFRKSPIHQEVYWESDFLRLLAILNK